MRRVQTITAYGAHAEGEAGRVITGGIPAIPGVTLLEKMLYLNQHDDSLRRLTLFEPRGGAHLSVNLLLPPVNPKADAGFIVMQSDEAHPMSGSNAMCVSTVLLETGMLPMQYPLTHLTLDTPAGLVPVQAHCADGKVSRACLQMPASYVQHLDFILPVPGFGEVRVDVAFGGSFFVLVDACQLGLEISAKNARALVAAATNIRMSADKLIKVQHPSLPSINSIDYVMFTDKGDDGKLLNATVYYPGRLDRSPCGTGSAARLAVMHAKGEIEPGESTAFYSVIGGCFEARILDTCQLGDFTAINPEVSGRSWIYASEQLTVDPDDPFPLGYVLSDTWGPGLEV
ncbi:proline racemase family protein [Endozoicomonadaceae bacterium StTr2]